MYQLNNNPTLIVKSNQSSLENSQKRKRPPLSPKQKIHSSKYKELLNQEQLLAKGQQQSEQQPEVRDCYESLMSKKSHQVIGQTPWDKHHNPLMANSYGTQLRISEDFVGMVNDSDKKTSAKDSPGLKRYGTFSMADSRRSDEIRKKLSQAESLQKSP